MVESKANQQDMLDSEKVSKRTWKHIRENAMSDDYQTKKWFKQLQPEDQELVEQLR